VTAVAVKKERSAVERLGPASPREPVGCERAKPLAIVEREQMRAWIFERGERGPQPVTAGVGVLRDVTEENAPGAPEDVTRLTVR